MPLPANRSPKRKLLLLATVPMMLASACALPATPEAGSYESFDFNPEQLYRECIEKEQEITHFEGDFFVAPEEICTDQTGYVPPEGNGKATDADPVEADPPVVDEDPVEAVPLAADEDQEEDRPDDTEIANDCASLALTPEECAHRGTHTYAQEADAGSCIASDDDQATFTFTFSSDAVVQVDEDYGWQATYARNGQNTYQRTVESPTTTRITLTFNALGHTQESINPVEGDDIFCLRYTRTLIGN